MAHTPTQQLTANILLAIRQANVTYTYLAGELEIGTSTFRRRLDTGKFTFPELEVIATATGRTIFDLLPNVVAA